MRFIHKCAYCSGCRSTSSKIRIEINSQCIYVINNIDISIDTISDWSSLALEKIKSSHSSGYYFYNDDIRNKVIEESEIEHAMDRALADREFQVYLQPEYNLMTEKIAGAKALMLSSLIVNF